jgi:uncharacterized membrane-anchored protein YhcB (DUF1043 family)
MTPEQVKNIFNGTYSRLLIILIIGVLVGGGVVIANRLQDDKQTQKTTAQKVNAWNAKYGYLITELGQDFAQAEKDSSADKVSALSADCSKIRTDAVAAHSKAPIPDAAVQADWTSALNADAAGGNNCVNGISAGSSTLMSSASSDFTQGSKALTAANTEIQKLK